MTVRSIDVALLFDLQFLSYVIAYHELFMIPFLNEASFVGIVAAPVQDFTQK